MREKVIKLLEKVYRLCRDIILFPKNLLSISSLINRESNYWECTRKTKKRMWMENFLYLLKYHEINIYYISYGFDVKDLKKQKEYIPHRQFVLKRDEKNQTMIHSHTGSYNYIVLLRDKYVFSAYISSVLGKKFVPETIALISNGKIFDEKEQEWISYGDFFKKDQKVVFKLIDGECADGVYLVDISKEQVKCNGRIYNWMEFCNIFGESRVIVQEIVQQHSSISKLNPYCVNTMRIVTIRDKNNNIKLFAAFLRLGTSNNSFVDNRAKGGMAVGINLNNGILMKYGFVHDSFGIKMTSHPLTDIVFENFQIPFWKETVDLVCKAHMQFYEIKSIGWDVVVTEKGPILLEGNDDWEIGGPQDTLGGLKDRWNELMQ